MVVTDELEFLGEIVDLTFHRRIVEVGCGAAALARRLLERFPNATVDAVDVDETQYAKNLADPMQRLTFHMAEGQSLPFETDTFDLALMLKSLHHVPASDMGLTLAEIARVLRPGGLLYVSEPLYAGPLNDIMRLFHDEETSRLEALAALRVASGEDGPFTEYGEYFFDVSVHYEDEADFESKMLHATFHDHRPNGQVLQEIKHLLRTHQTESGINFQRPMRVNLLQAH